MKKDRTQKEVKQYQYIFRQKGNEKEYKYQLRILFDSAANLYIKHQENYMRDSAENLCIDIGSEMVKNLIFLCFSSYPKEHCTSFPALSSTCHRETRKDDGIQST